MKIKTFYFKGRVELAECAKEIEKEGFSVILDKEGKELNGYLNGYIDTIDGEVYTLVDLFSYDENRSVKEDKEKHDKKHKIKKKEFDVKKIEKRMGKFHKADKSARIKLVKRFGKL